MKKKALERIPLHEAEGYDATAWEFGEDLVIDIREKDLRIVLGKKEYGNYQNGIWDERSLENLRLPELVTMPEKEEQMVIRWVIERATIHQVLGRWDAAVEKMEYRIRVNKRYRAAELREQRLEERCEAVPAVPDDFPAWTETCFGPSVLFYHRTSRRHAEVFCAKCGGTVKYAFRRTASFEGKFESLWEEPVRGQEGTCMLCGARGIYRSDRKQDTVLMKSGCAYILQKFLNGVVVRKFICERYSNPKRKDKYIQLEEARAYFLPDRKPLAVKDKVIMDYRYRDNWTGETRWHDCNTPGMSNITWQKGTIYPGSFEELKGTRYQYSGIREYYDWHSQINPKRYLECYNSAPALEYLVHARATRIVEHILECGLRSINEFGRNPSEVLRLPADQAYRFIRENGSFRQLELMQRAYMDGWKIDRQTERELIASGVEIYRIGIAMNYMGARKFLNQLMKYSRTNNPFIQWQAERIQRVSITYTDYLTMRDAQGYDMTNSIFLFPRDLTAAHHEMVVLQKNAAQELELARKEAAYGQKIKERLSAAIKRYAWKDGERMIFPAGSAREIVMEGRELHHCVGGDNYLSRHARGESTILFMRKQEEPEIPYITVEIVGGEINQWYGAYDKKTDKEENEEWLERYQQVLKKRAV